MSLQASIGSERNLFDETPEHARQLVLESPILLDSELEQLRQVHSAIFKARTLDITWAGPEGRPGWRRRSSASAARPTWRSQTGQHSSSSRPRRRPRTGPHPRRCPFPPFITTWCARAPATQGRPNRRIRRGAKRALVALLIGYGAAPSTVPDAQNADRLRHEGLAEGSTLRKST